MRRGRGFASNIAVSHGIGDALVRADLESGGAGQFRATAPTVTRRNICERINGVSKVKRRRRGCTRKMRLFSALACIITVVRVIYLLATWFPGDETIRACSESTLKIMISRSGISFGTRQAIHFAEGFKIEVGDSAIKRVKRTYVVQGSISKNPKWTEQLNVTHEAVVALEPPPPVGNGRSCFFRVHRDEAKITFYDDGHVIVHALNTWENAPSGTVRLSIDDLQCDHFRAMTRKSHRILLTEGSGEAAKNVSKASDHASYPHTPDVIHDGSSGRVLMLNSATTLEMISEYHRTLLNHQEYAEHHHYGFVLALIKSRTLAGRSGKFAKHLALGIHAAQTFISERESTGLTWNTICHMAGSVSCLFYFPVVIYPPHSSSFSFRQLDEGWTLKHGFRCMAR